MAIDSRISNLESKHSNLEEQLRIAYLTHENDNEISLIKKKKLSLKQQVNNLKTKFSST